MFFFFPFYGGFGGGFFLFILLILLGRVLRSLRWKDDDDSSSNQNTNGYTHYYYYNFGNNQQRTADAAGQRTSSQAYRILGVPETATEAEIKKAYRKLIMEYHPDTVASNDGLSEESKKYATRKFREVQEAYEQICRERGIK